MNLDGLVINEVILHDVPRGGDATRKVVLTDAPIELDDELRGYFRGKMIESLVARGLEAVADVNRDPAVRNAVTQILNRSTALPMASKAIALRLDSAQTRRNPAGLLTVMTARIGRQPYVGILKLEREQGVRFTIETSDGQSVVNLELLRNLTLTDKTKVFKTSLFFVKDLNEPLTMEGVVSDDQRGASEGRNVATFFLGTFLGCAPKSDASVATKQFTEGAESYFKTVDDAAKRARYYIALLARLQDNDDTISPRSFATQNLAGSDRQPFLAAIESTGLDPASAFRRDTSMVKLDRLRVVYQSGLTLIGRQEDFREHVDLPETASGDTRIRDVMANVLGH